MQPQIEKPAGTAIPTSFEIRSIPATTHNIRPTGLSGNSVFIRGQQEGPSQPSRLLDKVYSNCLPKGPRSKDMQSDYLDEEFKGVGKFSKRMRETKNLVVKLETHSKKHPAIGAVVKALRSCNAYMSVKDGKPSAAFSLCKNRHCVVCSVKVREERRCELMNLIDYRSAGWLESKLKHRANLAFITLTMRSHKGWSCKAQLNALKRVWGRFNKRREWRELYELGLGAYRATEIEHNKERKSWNCHLHLLVEVPQSMTMTGVKSVIGSAWKLAGGGFVSCKAVKNVRQQVLHVCKYMTKTFTKSGEVLSEIITATRGAQLSGMLGSWRRERAAAKEHITHARVCGTKNEIHLDEPIAPSPVNPKSGEVATPEDGHYTLDALVVRAKKREWNAIYLLREWKHQLRMMNYRAWLEKKEISKSVLDHIDAEPEGDPQPLNVCVKTLERMVQGKEHQQITAYRRVITA